MTAVPKVGAGTGVTRRAGDVQSLKALIDTESMREEVSHMPVPFSKRAEDISIS